MSDDRIFEVIVVGAGPAGVQCALLLRRLELDVLLVGSDAPSLRHSLLPREDGWNSSRISDEVSLMLAGRNVVSLARQSVPTLAAWVVSVRRSNRMLHVEIPGRTLLARNVVLATGAEGSRACRMPVLPDVADLDLDLHEDGMIEVDEAYRSSTTGIYAIGDLVGGMIDSVSCAMGTGDRAAWSVYRDVRAAA